MAGGIGPLRDSERRALVGTRQKESSRDEARLKARGFVPLTRMRSWERRQGSAMNDPLRGSPLTPLPAPEVTCAQKRVDMADDFIDGLR